jgi:hypothetical protein
MQQKDLDQALGGPMVVVLALVFVPQDLSVQFVGQIVDRRVQIGVGTFGKQVLAFDVDVALGTLAQVFFLQVVHR